MANWNYWELYLIKISNHKLFAWLLNYFCVMVQLPTVLGSDFEKNWAGMDRNGYCGIFVTIPPLRCRPHANHVHLKV